jgi:hypothetical protein
MSGAGFAKRVAEAILADAQSGSAIWDELNGPGAVLSGRYPENRFTITIPQVYDEPAGDVCVITVECGNAS